MKLYIKNMVCDRCKMVVENTLMQRGLHPLQVDLGEILLKEEEIMKDTEQQLVEDLKVLGFELLEDKRKILLTQIKAAIVDLVHHSREPLKINLSDYLSKKLDTEYSHLSSVFSAEQQDTIEHYYIRQKIEKVKELLSYGELTLSEIAYQLNYSSVAHLSAQFKKEISLTPTQYKQNISRNRLDHI